MTVKQHEYELMRAVLGDGSGVPVGQWDSLDKRALRVLEKWTRKGWWDWGVSVRAGWLTDDGRAALTAALEQTT